MNLRRVFDAINLCYFDGALQDVRLGWMRGTKGPRETIIFGLCYWTEQRIVMSPLLRHRSVPEWYAAFYMFHEMLHLVHPPVRVGRRVEIHHETFRAAERRFVHFEEVAPWEQANLKALFQADARRSSTDLIQEDLD